MTVDRIFAPALVALALLAGCEEGPPPELGTPADADPRADARIDGPDGAVAPEPEPEPRPTPDPEPTPEPAITIALDTAPLTLAVAEVATLGARVTDANGAPVDVALRWRTADGLVAWVSPEGAVLGVGVGETQIHAEARGVQSAPLTVRVEAARPAAPSYAATIDPILRAGCATAGCHVDDVEPGDLRFDRDPDRMWQELVEDDSEQTGIPRVAPGDPAGSYLIMKLALDQPPFGARMPLGRAPLPIEDMQAIVAWIAGGAPR